jgi:two-component system C4-dicarboxylate transport response regulator DctD
MIKGRVLLLDDDREILEICNEVLSNQGFDVSTFDDPMKALTALIEGQRTDVIITDFRMPGMNGLQFLEQLKLEGILTPTVMFTGVADKELAIKALNAGCHSLIEKPVRNQELIHYAEQAIAYGRWENISGRLLQECRDLIRLLRSLSSAYETRFTQAENMVYQNKTTTPLKPADIQGYLKNIAQASSIETDIQNATELVEALTREHLELQSRVRR